MAKKEIKKYSMEFGKKEKLPKPQNQIDTVLSGEFGRLLVKYVNRNNRQKERGQSNE